MPNVTFLENDVEDIELDNKNKLCKICSSAQGKYTCPRCNILYCSLPCYQTEAHSGCSESFYRQCVMDEMRCKDDDPQAERKMMEILQRMQQNEEESGNLDNDDEEVDSDDECEPDLAERLTSVNLDDADSVWEKLTPAERQEFEDLVRNGDVSDLLPPWKPWWKYRKETQLVVELDSASQPETESYIKSAPSLKQDIQGLSQITKCPPAEAVKFNVVNVLGAYCYVARWFNGDHLSFAPEAVQILAILSNNLSSGHNYESLDIALQAVSHEAVNCTWLGGCLESTTAMKSDVSCLLKGPEESEPSFYIRAALSDIHALLMAAKKSKDKRAVDGKFARRFGDNLNVETGSQLTKEKQRLCVKKIEYYLAWSVDYADKVNWS